MEILFVRHGEADYSFADKTGAQQAHWNDLAPLSAKGERQAAMAAADPRLMGASLIVSSPLTRALQTAAILHGATGIPLAVEPALYEWMPDVTLARGDLSFVRQANRAYALQRGEPKDGGIPFEAARAVFQRAHEALKRHAAHERIIVVAHGILIRQFVFADEIENCSIRALQWTPEFQWGGYMEAKRGPFAKDNA